MHARSAMDEPSRRSWLAWSQNVLAFPWWSHRLQHRLLHRAIPTRGCVPSAGKTRAISLGESANRSPFYVEVYLERVRKASRGRLAWMGCFALPCLLCRRTGLLLVISTWAAPGRSAGNGSWHSGTKLTTGHLETPGRWTLAAGATRTWHTRWA